jgi:uncharacterized protein YbbC (DUF1343 family)
MRYSAIFLLAVLLLIGACTRKSSTSKPVARNPPPTKMPPKEKPEPDQPKVDIPPPLLIGAEQLHLYLPDLQGKRVAMVVNHTSLIKNVHLVDTLLSLKIDVKKIFAPEHGFRGEADAGEHVSNAADKKTGLPLVSLYGKNKKPTPEQLRDVDVVVFDIQDVGARFFTYISTMHYVMEACAENGKKCLVLDRPNPNGHYFDGPILKPQFQSFVGMHPIPVVHGLTVGELANMINGQNWLANRVKCDLKVVKNANYTHRMPYAVPVRPSPNLPNDQAIRLYPTVCLFEGTIASVGRGTPFAFQVVGAPDPRFGPFTFTPVSMPGAKEPPHKDKLCYGLDLRSDTLNHFSLQYLIHFYNVAENKEKFFIKYFDTLVGTDDLRKQIQSGMTEEQIRNTWKEDLLDYKVMRMNYLLYPEQ